MTCLTCHDHRTYCEVCLDPIKRHEHGFVKDWGYDQVCHNIYCKCSQWPKICKTVKECLDPVHPRWDDTQLLEAYQDWLIKHRPTPTLICDTCNKYTSHASQWCGHCPGKLVPVGKLNRDSSLWWARRGVFVHPYNIADNPMAGPFACDRVQAICKPYIFELAKM